MQRLSEVEKTWTRAHLPICQAKHDIQLVDRFYETWMMLQEIQLRKKEEFGTHEATVTGGLVICQEDRVFLEYKFSRRRETFGSSDKVFVKKVNRKEGKAAAEDTLKKKKATRRAFNDSGAAAELSVSDFAFPTKPNSEGPLKQTSYQHHLPGSGRFS